MSVLLSGLAAVPGVLASAVFNRVGECVESVMLPPYEAVLLSQALDALTSGFDVFNATVGTENVSDFVAHCEGGMLALRRVDEYSVVTVTDGTVNQAMLNVAFNVVIVKLGKPNFGSGGVSARPSGRAPISSFSPSFSPSLSGAPVAGALGTATVKSLLGVYQRAMGPAAKAVLKAEMISLGLRPRTLTAPQYADLILILGNRIQNADWRKTFLADARALV